MSNVNNIGVALHGFLITDDLRFNRAWRVNDVMYPTWDIPDSRLVFSAK